MIAARLIHHLLLGFTSILLLSHSGLFAVADNINFTPTAILQLSAGISSQGIVGLTKLGGGTMILSTLNTYSGPPTSAPAP